MDCPHQCGSISRRHLMAGIAVGGVGALAGCLGGDDDDVEIPDSIALDGPKQCDVCGMLIEDTFGPNGQTFFDGEYPADRDGPAWYDSVRELCTDRFAQEDRYDPIVTYVTDYSTVDYDIQEVDDTQYISGAVERETLIRADEAVYVLESNVEGVMGPDLFPFSEKEDAEGFVEEHGGRILDWDDITPEVIHAQ